ncbi:MAG: PKD domain-containing protein, partial [Cytophagales bacterium]
MLSQLNLSHLVILCATITTFLFSCKKSNEPINELNANFISQPDSIYLFNKVNFTAIDTTQNADYYWDFGDSTTLITSESKISHKYKLKGSHTVTLKIKGVISNKKVYVYPGDISYKIINLSSKDIDFKSY